MPLNQGPLNMPMAYTAWCKPIAVVRWAAATWRMLRPINTG